MNSMSNRSMRHLPAFDVPPSFFAGEPAEYVIAFESDAVPPACESPARRSKPFERLLGTLSLADLNEYREAAGREPDLDAKALYALHDAADRFFPIRNDDTGGRYLRNAYLKYMAEHESLAEIGRKAEADPLARRFSA